MTAFLQTVFTQEAAIVRRAIPQDQNAWTPDVARGMLSLQFAESDSQRMDELAEKARNGELNEEEELEIESYRQAGRLLELLKANARVCLKNQDSARE